MPYPRDQYFGSYRTIRKRSHDRGCAPAALVCSQQQAPRKNDMRYEQRLIWVLGITFGFLFFDRNAAGFLMPFIARDLHFSNQQVGLIASALSFTWAVSAFLGGALSDRTRSRKPVLLASASDPGKRGHNMGVMQNFGSNILGSFAAPLVLVAIAEHSSWRMAFFLAGIPGLIMAVLIARYVHEPQKKPAPTDAGGGAGPIMSYLDMLKFRNMILCVLMSIFMVSWMVLGW